MKYPDTGGDVPCVDDDYADEYKRRGQRRHKWRDGILIGLAIIFIAAIVFLYR